MDGSDSPAYAQGPFDVGWLLRLRWVVAACGVGAAAVAHALGLLVGHGPIAVAIFVVWVVSTQLGLVRRWAHSEPRGRALSGALGALFIADVIALTAVLHFTGGPANPFSALYLVYVSLAAVALGPRWAWSLVVFSCVSYGILFLLSKGAASMHAMHGQRKSSFDTHLAGMWWAFVVSAMLAAAFLTRLAREVRTRDRALLEAEEQRARYGRLASLMSLAASAAHELGTPLGTIAVVAKELERELPQALRADASLVRREVDRCRAILDRLSTRSGELVGERPEPFALSELAGRVREELPSPLSSRLTVRVEGPGTQSLRLPPHAFAVAIANLVINAFEASGPEDPVELQLAVRQGTLEVQVRDQGEGVDMTTLPRIFDPFVTTKGTGGAWDWGCTWCRRCSIR